MNNYVIQQRVLDSHSEKPMLIRYLCERSSKQIRFSEYIEDAIKYDSIDSAKSALRKVFMRLSYHINIEYNIIETE